MKAMACSLDLTSVAQVSTPSSRHSDLRESQVSARESRGYP